jgi:hypothetical protein
VATITDQFTDLSISFDIIPSDHAALTIHWYPVLAVAIQPPLELVGYAVNEDGRLAWSKIFTSIPFPHIYDIPSLEAAALALHHNIDKACLKIFPKWKVPNAHGVCWWTPTCAAALSVVLISHGDECKCTV